MATDAQIAANRQNAESSTGPRTGEGKSRSSRNATIFGLYSAGDFVRSGEARTYRLFCQRFRKDLRPEGSLERTLAAEITHAAWRLRRCSVAESEMQWTEGEADLLLSRAQAAIDRARAQAQRQFLRATGELRRLQTERELRAESLPSGFPVYAMGGLTSIKEVSLFLQKIRKRDTFTLADLERATAPPTEIAAAKRTQSEHPEQPMVPRSAPCPCGSGLKYKRCCGRNAPAILHQAA